jgi:cellulose biosynthesis protein BcsQ
VIIAIYSAKGGVGKTTLAVNLAWASAVLTQRSTLLWDLDAQGAASYILGQEAGRGKVQEAITGKSSLASFIKPTAIDGLQLLPADYSLRSLDRRFYELGKRKRLAKVAAEISSGFDRVIIDCAPGMGNTSDQILRAANLIVVPVIPATLSKRALDEVKEHVAKEHGPKVILAPVFSMADRRRTLHCRELAQFPGWPIIPMSSAYERVGAERSPIGALLPRTSPPVAAIAALWARLEGAMMNGPADLERGQLEKA